MEKKFKPVPDMECLRYKGTAEKPDIKIFVSHRIDLDSETINNPLYIPVRCGAVFDERENAQMLGDDTGDNISGKRLTLNEFCVMYWAWKNVKADYYGLCHYRRYLNFSDEEFPTDAFGNILENYISNSVIEKYGLTEQKIRSQLENADIICSKPLDVRTFPGNYKNVKEQYSKVAPYLFESDIEILEQTISDIFPDYSEAARKYLYGYEGVFCNLFIMKKSLFFSYCEWFFKVTDILFQKIDMSNYSQEGRRSVAHLGERLFGIYLTYLKDKKIKQKFLQQIFFIKPEQIEYPKPVFSENAVTVAITSSNVYVPYLSVLLQSILENSSGQYQYDIVILSNGVTAENKTILAKQISCSNFSIRFVEVESYLDKQDLFVWGHFTKMTYARLAALDLFKNYAKLLYLDCDIVVNDDIAKLFYTDISNSYLAAVKDTVMSGWTNGLSEIETSAAKSLNLEKLQNYFNAGVLLFNIKEFSKDYTSNDLFETACKHKFRWVDQDTLNKVCEGKVHFLDNTWNFMTHCYARIQDLPEFYAPLKVWENYKKTDLSPGVIHYAGNVLPPNAPEVNHFWDFWQYARKTPFYEHLLRKMIWEPILGRIEAIERGRANSFPSQEPHKNFPHRVADVLFPKYSTRRFILKKLFSRKSLVYRLARKIYRALKELYNRRGGVNKYTEISPLVAGFGSESKEKIAA